MKNLIKKILLIFFLLKISFNGFIFAANVSPRINYRYLKYTKRIDKFTCNLKSYLKDKIIFKYNLPYYNATRLYINQNECILDNTDLINKVNAADKTNPIVCGDSIVISPNEECDFGQLNGLYGCTTSCRWQNINCTIMMPGTGLIDKDILFQIDKSNFTKISKIDFGDDSTSSVSGNSIIHQYQIGKIYFPKVEIMHEKNQRTSSCSSIIQIFTGNTCGNGKKEKNEDCDDGNQIPNDGCSPYCNWEELDCQLITDKTSYYNFEPVKFIAKISPWAQIKSINYGTGKQIKFDNVDINNSNIIENNLKKLNLNENIYTQIGEYKPFITIKHIGSEDIIKTCNSSKIKIMPYLSLIPIINNNKVEIMASGVNNQDISKYYKSGLWNWGDGNQEKGLFPMEHVYSGGGSYFIKYVLLDTDSQVGQTFKIPVDINEIYQDISNLDYQNLTTTDKIFIKGVYDNGDVYSDAYHIDYIQGTIKYNFRMTNRSNENVVMQSANQEKYSLIPTTIEMQTGETLNFNININEGAKTGDEITLLIKGKNTKKIEITKIKINDMTLAREKNKIQDMLRNGNIGGLNAMGIRDLKFNFKDMQANIFNLNVKIDGMLTYSAIKDNMNLTGVLDRYNMNGYFDKFVIYWGDSSEELYKEKGNMGLPLIHKYNEAGLYNIVIEYTDTLNQVNKIKLSPLDLRDPNQVGKIVNLSSQMNDENHLIEANINNHQNECQNLFWFKENSITNDACQAPQQFCGNYMSPGLKTFMTQDECMRALPYTFQNNNGLITLNLYEPIINNGVVSINGSVFSSIGNITNIAWDWGDNTSNDSFFPSVHQYHDQKDYLVTVIASDDRGDQKKTTIKVRLLPVPNIDIKGKNIEFIQFPEDYFDSSSISSSRVVEILDNIYLLLKDAHNNISIPDKITFRYNTGNCGAYSNSHTKTVTICKSFKPNGYHHWDVYTHEMSHYIAAQDKEFLKLAEAGYSAFMDENQAEIMPKIILETLILRNNRNFKSEEITEFQRSNFENIDIQQNAYEQYLQNKQYIIKVANQSDTEKATQVGQALSYMIMKLIDLDTVNNSNNFKKYIRFLKSDTLSMPEFRNNINSIPTPEEMSTYIAAAYSIAFNQNLINQMKQKFNMPINNELFLKIATKFRSIK